MKLSSILLLAGASNASSLMNEDGAVLCYSCLESTGDAHDNTGGKCHVPDGKTETVPMETDGVCTTVQGTILIDGEPTGDLVYTRRGTDEWYLDEDGCEERSLSDIQPDDNSDTMVLNLCNHPDWVAPTEEPTEAPIEEPEDPTTQGPTDGFSMLMGSLSLMIATLFL